MANGLSFRILGSLAVFVGERQLAVNGLRQRVILAVLILNAGRVVSIERLAEAIWGPHQPPTARNQIVICISGLRRALAEAGASGDLLGTAPPGYVLHARPEQVDALEAERLAAEGRAAQGAGDLETAAKLFRQACDQWRAPVLAGVESTYVEGEAHRLEDRRLTLTEERIQLELALGRHGDLIHDLTALVEANPLRERLRAQLMLAQYRGGRRAESLDTYRTGRTLLVDELGIDPGNELQSLHDAILRDALEPAYPEQPRPADAPPPAADPHRTVPAQLPADIPHFIGRADEQAELDALLKERASKNLLTIALITGVGGVGKSSLAVRWGHSVAHLFPDGQLFVDLRGYDLNAEPLNAGVVMDRFLRALGVGGDRIAHELDERAAQFRTTIAKRQLLIVLDNARVIEQVRPLLPGSGNCCVIVTSRDPLGDLTAREGATMVHLDVLSATDSAALLAGVADPAVMDEDPGATARLGRLCDGLPLALRIVGARLTARSYWTPARLVKRLADERRRLDELSYGQLTVRATFALSYRDLSPEAARMFRRLGLLEVPDFAPWVGAALLDIDDIEGENLIEQLVDAQLLEAVGRDCADQVRYRFHDLVRLYAKERALAEESEQERMEAVSRALAGWLSLTEEAHRREYGGAFTQMHGAVTRWRPQDVDLLLERPLHWLDSERGALICAVSQASDLGLTQHCWDLAVTATTLFESRSYFDDWRTTHEIALAAARAAGDVRGEGAVLCSLGSMHLFQQSPDRAGERLCAALELFEGIGERFGRALVLRSLSLLDRLNGRFDHALARYEEAREIFAVVGDHFAEAHVLGGIAQVHLDQNRLELARTLLAEALEAFTRLGSERGRAQILNRLGETLLRLGRLEEAESACEAALALVRQRLDGIGQAYILCGLGEIRLRQGRLRAAAESLDEALFIAREVRERFVEARVHLALGELRSRQDRLDEAVRDLSTARDIYASLDIRLWRFRSLAALGRVLARKGDVAAAAETLKSSLTCWDDPEAEECGQVRELLAELS
ncbi:BTAD domain-containing putative transcriptional regulator [Nonomuraea rosea]|uniref:BTAD domain-containing putative transcriptional regulator n=1 Tax=Nonomuraea rosea TaxID=638574 RepID=A0ABP6YPX9_9ACTN